MAAAEGFAADICAAHVGFDPKYSFVDAEEQDIQQLRNLFEGAPEARTAQIKATVDAFVASHINGPQITWHDDHGDIAANVKLEAYSSRLMVIGRPVHMDAADALHSALFDAHRLVLVAPRDASSAERTIGRHIVIGWKPGTPVERAAEAALPWLRKAEKVSVIWVPKGGKAPYDASGRQFFERLGIAANVIRLEPNGQSVGAQLLAETTRLGGDCLLIGAFRHSALWNALLGGVTHDVLAHAEIPVFMMRAR
ncbi:universal stress protein [Rhodoblastus sp.]|uniref:universal stress protein n=1 Tax=Rhodoblastus sp. TaxID=1962975 RepID=UPI00262F1FEF|nr:universal stress protein [Rhodoblastus sp.]